MPPKLFIFDLGKVLVDFDFEIAIKELERTSLIDRLKIFTLFRTSTLATDWDTGVLHPAKFYETIQTELSIPMPINKFIPIWNSIFTEKSDMVLLALELRKRFKTAVLSNTNPWHIEYVKENFKWIHSFNAIYASCDLKLMKPDPKIYRHVLQKMSVKPEETIYIDDIPEYVAAAKALGIDGIVFTTRAKLVRDLSKRDITLG